MLAHSCIAGLVLTAGHWGVDDAVAVPANHGVFAYPVASPSEMPQKPEQARRAAPPQTPLADKPAVDRDELRRQALRDAAVQGTSDDPDAGAEVRDNGVADGVAGPAAPGVGDPEVAAYEEVIRQLFAANFRPLPSVTAANPGIEARLSLQIDFTSGRIVRAWVSAPSGNASYDGAALRAAHAVGTLPLPPERIAGRYAAGYNIKLKPPARGPR